MSRYGTFLNEGLHKDNGNHEYSKAFTDEIFSICVIFGSFSNLQCIANVSHKKVLDGCCSTLAFLTGVFRRLPSIDRYAENGPPRELIW